jgi:hypothetical protein
MNTLIQFFIEQASKSGDYLFGLCFAAAIFLIIIMVGTYQILDLIIKELITVKANIQKKDLLINKMKKELLLK